MADIWLVGDIALQYACAPSNYKILVLKKMLMQHLVRYIGSRTTGLQQSWAVM